MTVRRYYAQLTIYNGTLIFIFGNAFLFATFINMPEAATIYKDNFDILGVPKYVLIAEDSEEKKKNKKTVHVEIKGYKKCMKKIRKMKDGMEKLRDTTNEISELKKKL